MLNEGLLRNTSRAEHEACKCFTHQLSHLEPQDSFRRGIPPDITRYQLSDYTTGDENT